MVPARTSSFKYYIHDAVDSCRLELLGNLTENELPEMSGCWQTAKTTLGARKLVLDLRRLQNADSAAEQWLTSMASEGAAYLPNSFLRDRVESLAAESAAAPAKLSLLGRVLGMLRSGCIAPAD